MTNKLVYVVFGEAGEYSDYRTWNVAAYYSKDEAELHAEAASQAARIMYQSRFDNDQYIINENPFDAFFASNYEQAYYTVEELKLSDRWPGIWNRKCHYLAYASLVLIDQTGIR